MPGLTDPNSIHLEMLSFRRRITCSLDLGEILVSLSLRFADTKRDGTWNSKATLL